MLICLRIVQLYGTKVKIIYIFVPIYGTKDDERLILYNFSNEYNSRKEIGIITSVEK